MTLVAITLILAAPWTAALAADEIVTVGGAGAPTGGTPPAFVIKESAELSAGSFSVRVPTGTYTAPPGGAPNYTVPGPISAFKGADGVWRGHGYLETYPRLLKFTGTSDGKTAQLNYEFENGKSYRVTLEVQPNWIALTEVSDLGPRNLYVFDGHLGDWLASSGVALDATAKKRAFIYLPCYYDKPEVTIQPALLAQPVEAGATPPPGGAALFSASAAKKDVAGFWCRDLANWAHPESMGIQVWQRRQLPGDPSSRHFLGPETKSDSTPNPRTQPLLGKSLYEGHATFELSLGQGTRKLGFAAVAKGTTQDTLTAAFEAVAQKNR